MANLGRVIGSISNHNLRSIILEYSIWFQVHEINAKL